MGRNLSAEARRRSASNSSRKSADRSLIFRPRGTSSAQSIGSSPGYARKAVRRSTSIAEQSSVGVRSGSGSTYFQKLIGKPSRSWGPGGSSWLGTTTGAPCPASYIVTAISRSSQPSIGVRSLGMQVATRATTGAGFRCTMSENRSLSTVGSSTRRSFSQSLDTTASTESRWRSSRTRRRLSNPLRVVTPPSQIADEATGPEVLDEGRKVRCPRLGGSGPAVNEQQRFARAVDFVIDPKSVGLDVRSCGYHLRQLSSMNRCSLCGRLAVCYTLRDDLGDVLGGVEVRSEPVLGQRECGPGLGVGVGVAPAHAPHPEDVLRLVHDRTRHATDHKEEESMHVELDGLSEAQIVRVGNYERCNKNRETLLEQIEPRACRVQRQPR